MADNSSESVKCFDDLYSNYCTQLRKSGKAASLCEQIRLADSNSTRVHILLGHYKDVIVDCVSCALHNKGADCKNSARARELLQEYRKNKEENLNTEHQLELLNSALVLVEEDSKSSDFLKSEDFSRILEYSFIEELINENCNSSEKDLLKCTKTATQDLLCEIYKERSEYYYYSAQESYICLEDCVRVIKLMKNNNDEEKNNNLFTVLFRMGASYKSLELIETAGKVLQLSIKLLRESNLDNMEKSKETVRLVKLMKEVHEAAQPLNSKKGTVSGKNKKQCGRRLPSLFERESDILVGASTALQLKWESDKGRNLVAKKTIPPGAIVIIENPYAWVVHPKEMLKFCLFCCKETKSIYSCKKCSSVVFCSIACRDKSDNFHKFECEFLKCIISSETLGDMALLCYRTISKTDVRLLTNIMKEYTVLQEKIKNQDSSPEIDITGEMEKSDSKLGQMKFTLGLNKDGKLDSQNYLSVFAQTPNSEGRLSGDLLKRTFSAIYLTTCLRLADYFGKKECYTHGDFSEEEFCVASLLLRHLQSASCNAYGINCVRGENPRQMQITEVGGATYPIISTTNHSCNQNIYRCTVGNVCVVKSLREIKAGEEISDSYGPHFASTSQEERSRYLYGQYLFTCQCAPCTHDWGLYSQLPKESFSITCSRCGTESCAVISNNNGKGKRKCSKCSMMVDVKKIMKIVKEAEREFLASKEILLNSKNDGWAPIDYAPLERSIALYVSVLGGIQKWPCKALVECQEALKLCWNLENRN